MCSTEKEKKKKTKKTKKKNKKKTQPGRGFFFSSGQRENTGNLCQAEVNPDSPPGQIPLFQFGNSDTDTTHCHI